MKQRKRFSSAHFPFGRARRFLSGPGWSSRPAPCGQDLLPKYFTHVVTLNLSPPREIDPVQKYLAGHFLEVLEFGGLCELAFLCVSDPPACLCLLASTFWRVLKWNDHLWACPQVRPGHPIKSFSLSKSCVCVVFAHRGGDGKKVLCTRGIFSLC